MITGNTSDTCFDARSSETTGRSPDISSRTACIVEEIDQHSYRLDNGLAARRAYSCTVVPAVNDRVLIYHATVRGEDNFILHVLERQSTEAACISVPGSDELHIRQANLHLAASQQINLSCAGDIRLSSLAGAIRVQARQWVASILGSIVETAREKISRAEFVQMHASVMCQIQSKQAMIIAEEDIKIDAERVNLG